MNKLQLALMGAAMLAFGALVIWIAESPSAPVTSAVAPLNITVSNLKRDDSDNKYMRNWWHYTIAVDNATSQAYRHVTLKCNFYKGTEPVTERIINIDMLIASERLTICHLVTSSGQSLR